MLTFLVNILTGASLLMATMCSVVMCGLGIGDCIGTTPPDIPVNIRIENDDSSEDEWPNVTVVSINNGDC